MKLRKWKLILVALIAMLLLSACGAPGLPEESKIAADLRDYYQSKTEQAYLIDSVEFTKQDYYKEDKSAGIACTVTVSSDDKTFCRIDTWHMTYTYSDRKWTMGDAVCVETSYELLSDLTKTDCADFISNEIGQEIEIDSLVTDRAGKSATAVYSYESESADFGEYGSITMFACGDAFFSWAPSSGWNLDNCELNESTRYSCNLVCHIISKNHSLQSRRFDLEFDVNVAENVATIDDVMYQGDIRALGEVMINNTQFQVDENGKTAIISFDYVRDVSNIKSDKNYMDLPVYEQFYQTASGKGELRIQQDNAGIIYGSLFLSDFISDGDDGWFDAQPAVELCPQT